MTASGPKSLPSIGFLTVCQHGSQGVLGGYLILNAVGRPLEFHCTAPVRPNRAQQILYGPTLKPFLYGEQIGHTLLAKAKIKPLLVCTDVEPAMAVRETMDLPVVLVDSTCARGDAGRQVGMRDHLRLDSAHGQVEPANAPHLISFAVGDHQMSVSRRFAEDRCRVLQRWQPYANDLDLLEPFARIRDAIKEAQKVR